MVLAAAAGLGRERREVGGPVGGWADDDRAQRRDPQDRQLVADLECLGCIAEALQRREAALRAVQAVNEIARLYRVHRATAGRWLERARDTILTTTRARLMERLNIPRSEIESIVRLVLSQLEINMRPLFGGRAPRPAPKHSG